MSQAAALSLMRELQRLNSYLFDELVLNIERDYAASKGLPVGSMVGQGQDLINEAQIRQYILDPIFNRLGWKVESLEQMLVEAPAESQHVGAHRRFLDYHGREVTFSGEATSLLIVEAKRLSVKFLSSVTDGVDATGDIKNALCNLNDSSCSLTVTWKDILITLTDYVSRISKPYEKAPKRLLLTNGNWFIVFKKPYKTLVDKRVETCDLVVFIDLADASKRADLLYKLLSYETLCEHIPPQHCADLYKFLNGENISLDVCLSVAVSTTCLPNIQPVIGMTMVAMVRIPNAGWVQFRFDNNDHEYVLLEHRADQIENNMAELSERARNLLSQLRQYAQLRIISAADFETACSSEVDIPEWPHTLLFERVGTNHYLMHLGDNNRPLLSNANFDDCIYHSHGACFEEGVAVREQPLLTQSTDPAVYFPSGSPFHCAHKIVHSNREDRCQIQALDEFLCCRRCALQERCWPKDFDKFPCKSPD